MTLRGNRTGFFVIHDSPAPGNSLLADLSVLLLPLLGPGISILSITSVASYSYRILPGISHRIFRIKPTHNQQKNS